VTSAEECALAPFSATQCRFELASVLWLGPCQLVASYSIQFGIEVGAALLVRVAFFNGNAMGVGPGILTNSRDLSGNLDAGLAGEDGEAIVVDLLSDDALGELFRSRSTDSGSHGSVH